MTRRTTAVLAAVLVALLLAPTAAAATLRIASAGPKPGDHVLRVEVGDFRLVGVQASPANRAGEGHIHYLLNGKAAPGDYATPATDFTFRGLKDGDSIGAELVNNDHSSLSPQVLASQKVGGALPGFEPLLALAAVGAALLGFRRRR